MLMVYETMNTIPCNFARANAIFSKNPKNEQIGIKLGMKITQNMLCLVQQCNCTFQIHNGKAFTNIRECIHNHNVEKVFGGRDNQLISPETHTHTQHLHDDYTNKRAIQLLFWMHTCLYSNVKRISTQCMTIEDEREHHGNDIEYFKQVI